MSRAVSLAEKIKAAKACCRAILSKLNSDLMNKEWEVLVIKRDADSGNYVTETLCCADANHK
jgi:hypothetical protein